MDPRTDFLKLERIESIHEVRTRVATEDLKYCMVGTAAGRTNLEINGLHQEIE